MADRAWHRPAVHLEAPQTYKSPPRFSLSQRDLGEWKIARWLRAENGQPRANCDECFPFWTLSSPVWSARLIQPTELRPLSCLSSTTLQHRSLTESDSASRCTGTKTTRSVPSNQRRSPCRLWLRHRAIRLPQAISNTSPRGYESPLVVRRCVNASLTSSARRARKDTFALPPRLPTSSVATTTPCTPRLVEAGSKR